MAKDGGGMYILNPASSISFDGNKHELNKATNNGGAIYISESRSA